METNTQKPEVQEQTPQNDPNQLIELKPEFKDTLVEYFDLEKNPRNFNNNQRAMLHTQIGALLAQDKLQYKLVEVQAMVNHILQPFQKEYQLIGMFNTQSGNMTVVENQEETTEETAEAAK